jgi:hypothetical protein
MDKDLNVNADNESQVSEGPSQQIHRVIDGQDADMDEFFRLNGESQILPVAGPAPDAQVRDRSDPPRELQRPDRNAQPVAAAPETPVAANPELAQQPDTGPSVGADAHWTVDEIDYITGALQDSQSQLRVAGATAPIAEIAGKADHPAGDSPEKTSEARAGFGEITEADIAYYLNPLAETQSSRRGTHLPDATQTAPPRPNRQESDISGAVGDVPVNPRQETETKKPAASKRQRDGDDDQTGPVSARQRLEALPVLRPAAALSPTPGTPTAAGRPAAGRNAPSPDLLWPDDIPSDDATAAQPATKGTPRRSPVTRKEVEKANEIKEYQSYWRAMQAKINRENTEAVFRKQLDASLAVTKASNEMRRKPVTSADLIAVDAAAVPDKKMPARTKRRIEDDTEEPKQKNAAVVRKPRATRPKPGTVPAVPDANGWYSTRKHEPVRMVKPAAGRSGIRPANNRNIRHNFMDSDTGSSSEESSVMPARKMARQAARKSDAAEFGSDSDRGKPSGKPAQQSNLKSPPAARQQEVNKPARSDDDSSTRLSVASGDSSKALLSSVHGQSLRNVPGQGARSADVPQQIQFQSDTGANGGNTQPPATARQGHQAAMVAVRARIARLYAASDDETMGKTPSPQTSPARSPVGQRQNSTQDQSLETQPGSTTGSQASRRPAEENSSLGSSDEEFYQEAQDPYAEFSEMERDALRQARDRNRSRPSTETTEPSTSSPSQPSQTSGPNTQDTTRKQDRGPRNDRDDRSLGL